MELVLERKIQRQEPPLVVGTATLLITPPIDEDYWAYRVRVGGGQAVVGFPKFTTVGIGFAVEEDWNTNLPYVCPASEIFDHIKHNKGAATATDAECVEAIDLIRRAVRYDRPDGPELDSISKVAVDGATRGRRRVMGVDLGIGR